MNVTIYVDFNGLGLAAAGVKFQANLYPTPDLRYQMSVPIERIQFNALFDPNQVVISASPIQ